MPSGIPHRGVDAAPLVEVPFAFTAAARLPAASSSLPCASSFKALKRSIIPTACTQASLAGCRRRRTRRVLPVPPTATKHGVSWLTEKPARRAHPAHAGFMRKRLPGDRPVDVFRGRFTEIRGVRVVGGLWRPRSLISPTAKPEQLDAKLSPAGHHQPADPSLALSPRDPIRSSPLHDAASPESPRPGSVERRIPHLSPVCIAHRWRSPGTASWR